MSKLARRHRKRRTKKASGSPSSSFKRNPPLVTDLIEWVVPGTGGFVATRLTTRLAQQQIAKRWPKFTKHAGAIASIGSFLGAYFLGGRWKYTAKYHTPIVVGSAIAMIQSLAQIYAPKMLGWMMSDATPAPKIAASSKSSALPEHMEEVHDDPAWYTYNDAYDSGRYAGSLGTKPLPTPGQITNAPTEDAPIDDMQDGDDELAAGIFGN